MLPTGKELPSFAAALHNGVCRTDSFLAGAMAAHAACRSHTCCHSQVTQGAIRRVSNQVFKHLHDLDMTFHLGRQTGANSLVACS
jgi:hypothetical protein